MAILKLFSYPYRIFHWFFTTLRHFMSFVFLLIFFLSLFSLIGIYLKYESETALPKQSGILLLDLKGAIVDNPVYDSSFYQLISQLDDENQSKRENSLFELIAKIKQASQDEKIKALVLKVDGLTSVSFTSLQDLSTALLEFKQHGKKIYAIGGQYDIKRYYLAALADEIEFLPQGQIELYGLSTEQFYFKSFLDKLDVSTQIFKVGTYKSAVEPFIRDDMSIPAKENAKRWTNLLWKNYLNEIETLRKIPKNELIPEPAQFIQQLKDVNGDIASYALNNKIIDNLMPNPVFKTLLDERYPNENLLSIYDYALKEKPEKKSIISIVFVEGTLAEGKNSANVAGSTSIINELNAAVERKSSAIVLRVNSPGGGVFASESIRQALKSIRQKGIPIVVSMGSMAASGGYWIATESDYIYANQNTLTGSIGIFGIVPNVQGALNKLGIYTDGVSTSELAQTTIVKPLTNEMSEVFQLQIDQGYQTFISIVAEARKMSQQSVDQIAQGQVWLGEEALNHNLVDAIGSLDDAVQKASELAKVSDYSVFMPKNAVSFLEKLVLSQQVGMPKQIQTWLSVFNPILSEIEKPISLMSSLNDPKGQYLWCESCL